MNRRELIILAVLTGGVLFLTASMYNIRYQSGDQEYMGTLWLENLDINAVTRIDVIGPGNMPQVSLERRPEGWGVVQRQHYPANVGAIRSLLLDLSEVELLERKTSDPAQHAQLGLGGIERLEAKGQQITLHSAESARSVRIGASPDGRSATYVRSVGDDQGWLVDRTFTIPSEPRRWLDPELLDIGMEHIRRMEVVHPDGERIEGQRAEGAGDVKFTVLNLPEGAVAEKRICAQPHGQRHHQPVAGGCHAGIPGRGLPGRRGPGPVRVLSGLQPGSAPVPGGCGTVCPLCGALGRGHERRGPYPGEHACPTP